MNDELLTTFRSEVPLPDGAAARQAHEHATSGRPRLPRRRLALSLTAAAICAVGAALVSTGTFVGGADAPATHVRLGQVPLNYMKVDFTASDHTFTSIALTIHTPHNGDMTIRVRVWRSDASQVPQTYHATNHVVFQEQAPMTDSTWSGTLSPSNWDGGCQDALYEIQATVYPAGSSIASQSDTTAWFQCHGPFADPANPFPNSFSN